MTYSIPDDVLTLVAGTTPAYPGQAAMNWGDAAASATQTTRKTSWNHKKII